MHTLRMRNFLPGTIGAVCLWGCMTTEVKMDPWIIQPGNYAANFSPEFDSLGFESEFILESTLRHRWFSVKSNFAMFTSHGKWTANSEKLLLHHQMASHVAYNLFGNDIIPELFWDFEKVSDDQIPIRNLTETSFEKYEASPDNRRMMWVEYRRSFQPEIAPFKYIQVIPNLNWWRVDSLGDTLWEKSWMEYEFLPAGGFIAYGYTDSVRKVEFDVANYQLQGSFLVSDHPVKSWWDADSNDFVWPDTLRGEWIFRLNNITDSGFQIWDVTSFPEKWKDFKKAN